MLTDTSTNSHYLEQVCRTPVGTMRTGPGAAGCVHQYFSDISTPKWCYFNTTGNNSVVRQYWIWYIYGVFTKLIPRIKKLLKFLYKLNCKYRVFLLWFSFSYLVDSKEIALKNKVCILTSSSNLSCDFAVCSVYWWINCPSVHLSFCPEQL